MLTTVLLEEAILWLKLKLSRGRTALEQQEGGQSGFIDLSAL